MSVIRNKKAYLQKSEARDALKNITNKFRTQAIDQVAKSLEISKEEAEELVSSDSDFQDLMEIKDKEIRMYLIDTMYPKFAKAANEKLDSGSMEQAKHALTGISIIKDKAMGTDKYSAKEQRTSLNLKGQNLQINVGFPFKPYKATKKKIKSKE